MDITCLDCQQGITGYFLAQPVTCRCPAGLSVEMALVSKRLNDATETQIAMEEAGLESAAIEAYCQALRYKHDTLEAEYERRRTNE